MKIIGAAVVGLALGIAAMSFQPAHAIDRKSNSASQTGNAGAMTTTTSPKKPRSLETETGRPATTAVPLSVTECEGIGGKVMESVRSCGTGVACATVSPAGVVKAVCITSIQ